MRNLGVRSREQMRAFHFEENTNSQLLAAVPVPSADDGGERAVGREGIVAVVT